jgi:RNA polymerase sigma factor (sigma-70 family)
MSVESDESLVDALATGDAGAMRPLYERHAAAMLRLLRRLTSDVSVAEEILQETWLAVWQSAGSYQRQSSVRGWLLGVARRQAHNRLRRKEAVTVELEEAGDVADPAVDVEARIVAAADHAQLVAAVAGLPEHLREVVVLALVEDLPPRDIAVALGIPPGTVRSRMHHARAQLAKTLAADRGIHR